MCNVCVLRVWQEPATQYVVSVRAFNDVDKGPVIYDLVYTASGQGVPYVLTQYHSYTFTVLGVNTRRFSDNNTTLLAWCLL